MTTPSDAVPGISIDRSEAPPAAMRLTRPFYWSLRRELWENRSVWIAPLIVAAFALLGFAISTIGLAERRRAVLLLDRAQWRAKIGMPYDMVAMVLIVTGLIVAIFYCLDALHGERRDRSILFWKSLPVSDRTTVLSKAAVPLAIVPALIFTLVVVTQLLMAAFTSVVLLAHGMSPASTFAGWNPFVQSVILLYGLVVLVLWHAPLYAWFILVSGWAKRAIFLAAVIPLIAASAVFRVAWGSTDVCSLLVYRAVGWMNEAFIFAKGGTVSSLSQLTPGKFFAEPGLWVGLALAAVFLAAAVRVRRNREPI
jgi:ABC-2 type transport system permease protein